MKFLAKLFKKSSPVLDAEGKMTWINSASQEIHGTPDDIDLVRSAEAILRQSLNSVISQSTCCSAAEEMACIHAANLALSVIADVEQDLEVLDSNGLDGYFIFVQNESRSLESLQKAFSISEKTGKRPVFPRTPNLF